MMITSLENVLSTMYVQINVGRKIKIKKKSNVSVKYSHYFTREMKKNVYFIGGLATHL